MTMPAFFRNSFVRATHTNNKMPTAAAIRVSTTKPEAKVTGVIRAVVPTIKRMLKMLLPTIFPMAISALCFRAADTLVTSSGRLVPNATMVSPIKR